MSEQNQQPEVASEDQQEAVLQIQRIYVKDVSFEAPNLPHIFHQEWKPKLGLISSCSLLEKSKSHCLSTTGSKLESSL